MLMQRGRDGIAFDQHVRRHVVQHAAQAAGEAEAADRREVMDDHAAGDRGVVVNVDVAAQQRGVGHDHAAADAAIVGDVAAGHDEAVAAERGDAVFLFGAAIDRHAFADDVVVADDHLRCRCRDS